MASNVPVKCEGRVVGTLSGRGKLSGSVTLAGGLVFGLALSVASTVVLLRALQERRLVETERGRIAVGWLIVQDLFTVLILVAMPAMAAGRSFSRPTRLVKAMCSPAG